MLYKNFRSKRGGEIDLVCRDRHENTLAFVEVKTRTTDVFGPPHEGVTRAQQDRIIRGAKEWLRLSGRSPRTVSIRRGGSFDGTSPSSAPDSRSVPNARRYLFLIRL